MFGAIFLVGVMVIAPIVALVEWDYKRRYRVYYGHGPLLTGRSAQSITGAPDLDTALEEYYQCPDDDNAAEVQYQIECAAECCYFD